MGTAQQYGFIGGGNMAEALIKGIIESETAKPDDIFFFDPDTDRQQVLTEQYKIQQTHDNVELLRKSSVIVLAVKPQLMDRVLSEIQAAVRTDHLVVSVAAGVTIGHLQSALGPDIPIIRVMPNTPALVLAGASALSPGKNVNDKHMNLALGIFQSVGLAVEVEEKHMDVVTGLSGSGPAYIFILLEAMADGAVRLGLPRKQAQALAAQTILGAAKLARDSEIHPGQLKDMVMSPGGTTAQGIFALEKGAFRSVVQEAIAAAADKSRELGRAK